LRWQKQVKSHEWEKRVGVQTTGPKKEREKRALVKKRTLKKKEGEGLHATSQVKKKEGESKGGDRREKLKTSSDLSCGGVDETNRKRKGLRWGCYEKI